MSRFARWLKRAEAAVFAAILLAAPASPAATPPRARVRIEGLGLLRDLTLRHTVQLLLGSERGPVLKAAAIEDAALMIFTSLDADGYLKARIRVTVVDASGARATYAVDPTLTHPLPRPLAAREAIFEVKRGRRFTLARVTFTGLSALSPAQAGSYFRGVGILAPLTAEQAYSPGRLKRSIGNLLGELQRRGYAEASVKLAGKVKVDAASGRATARIVVSQGPLWRVAGFDLRVTAGPRPPDLRSERLRLPRLGLPWTTSWQHSAEEALRRWYYAAGRPDVTVVVTAEPGPEANGIRAVTARVEVNPGPSVRLGAIRFAGNTRTRESVLRPLVHAKPGQPLNAVELQEAQFRMASLGVFQSVHLSYVPPTGPVRDALYTVQEGRKQTVDLLLGWGSYDELRAGAEWRYYGLFSRANESYLKFVQSLKGSNAEYDFSVPELLGTEATGTAKLFGFDERLLRFVDEEYGANLSVSRAVPGIGADLLTGYTLEQLGASQDSLATQATDLKHARVGTVQVSLTRDRLDNPLEPRHGYKIYLGLVEGSRWLGGQVEFQQYQLSASYHTNWGPSRWIHLGFTNAALTTFGAPASNPLPPNVLYFPGGEDSIRGYGEGQAAARNAAGAYLGVRTYMLLNLELEQALTSKLSLVLFNDDLGAATQISDYPFSYRLYSVGIGLNYRTLVGPVRLEYGRNLNPRLHDPPGTLQFSVGVPF
ncbi:MAG: BamA/OMP85 family outer membrane protein [Opitutaceae bacterium]